MERLKLAADIIVTCQEMNATGLNQRTSGNVSVRYLDGMLITPSGIPYTKMTPDIIVFVDACFSGKTDNVSTLKGIAAGVLKSKKLEFDKNKMVVLSAGSAKQFSNSYDDKGHRLFSYFLMKNILENEHLDIDLLYKKTAAQVKEVSWAKGDTYLQEPTIEGNSAIKLK